MTAALDPEVLDRQAGGDTALQREVLALFIRQAEAAATELRRAADSDARRLILHRLQGSARAVGARRVDAAAASLEAALGPGGTPWPAGVEELGTAIADACRYAAVLRFRLAPTASPNDLKADKHLRPSMSHSNQRQIRGADS